MTDKEVYEALLAGKKLALPTWTSGTYWEHLNDNGRLVDNEGKETELSPAEHYTIVEEPKKYQVLYYIPSFKEYVVSDSKYSDEKDFNNFFNGVYEFIQLLKERS